jgi:hypothetical protein
VTTAADFRQKVEARRTSLRIAGPFPLPVTKTFPTWGDRQYQAEFPGPDGAICRLTIQQKKKAESYGLLEDEQERPGMPDRLFVFGKLTGKVTDKAPGFYQVRVRRYYKTLTARCDCIGTGTSGDCKHAQTLLDLLARDLIPSDPLPQYRDGEE